MPRKGGFEDFCGRRTRLASGGAGGPPARPAPRHRRPACAATASRTPAPPPRAAGGLARATGRCRCFLTHPAHSVPAAAGRLAARTRDHAAERRRVIHRRPCAIPTSPREGTANPNSSVFTRFLFSWWLVVGGRSTTHHPLRPHLLSSACTHVALAEKLQRSPSPSPTAGVRMFPSFESSAVALPPSPGQPSDQLAADRSACDPTATVPPVPITIFFTLGRST